MSEPLSTSEVGTPLVRWDGRAKVTGAAPYAFEQQLDRPTHCHALQATIARGRITGVDTGAAESVPGVVVVMTHLNAPRLADTDDRELSICQSDEVSFRGQVIGAVVAQTPEAAREAVGRIVVEYDEQPHRSELSAPDSTTYAPESVNPSFATDTLTGDPDAAFDGAEVQVDRTYSTPRQFNNPMEPHTCVAVWEGEGDDARATLFDSTQSVHGVRRSLAPVLGIEPDRLRVVSPYVGGGFGSKGLPHAHDTLALMAARMTGGRPVKLAVTRQQMFDFVGYRTPTVQRLRLGAAADGRLVSLSHDVVEQTARIKEFAEQTATVTRMMYAAPHRRTSHRLEKLDVAVPSWMRAPGECPGMFGLETAMDELAEACGLDPVELRVRNEPERDPESGLPWSGRRLVECLRTGAERFGWSERGPAGSRREGRWRVGLGVAASTYPANVIPGSSAEIEFAGGRYSVRIGAADIGTGTWTALRQVSADALGLPTDEVDLEIGDTDLPHATVEGGSSGLSSWGSTVVAAAREFRDRHGKDPDEGARTVTEMPRHPDREDYSTHSFGAVFAEARVHADTGEVRVPRMLGVYAPGRIVNPGTARSQLIGGLVFGLSMALFENGVMDHRSAHVVTRDLAEYHIPTNADVGDIDAIWLDDVDVHANVVGAKGIGEIGIVGSPAAVGNAVHNATGIRVRDLPISCDDLIR